MEQMELDGVRSHRQGCCIRVGVLAQRGRVQSCSRAFSIVTDDGRRRLKASKTLILEDDMTIDLAKKNGTFASCRAGSALER